MKHKLNKARLIHSGPFQKSLPVQFKLRMTLVTMNQFDWTTTAWFWNWAPNWIKYTGTERKAIQSNIQIQLPTIKQMNSLAWRCRSANNSVWFWIWFKFDWFDCFPVSRSVPFRLLINCWFLACACFAEFILALARDESSPNQARTETTISLMAFQL